MKKYITVLAYISLSALCMDKKQPFNNGLLLEFLGKNQDIYRCVGTYLFLEFNLENKIKSTSLQPRPSCKVTKEELTQKTIKNKILQANSDGTVSIFYYQNLTDKNPTDTYTWQAHDRAIQSLSAYQMKDCLHILTASEDNGISSLKSWRYLSVNPTILCIIAEFKKNTTQYTPILTILPQKNDIVRITKNSSKQKKALSSTSKKRPRKKNCHLL